MAKFVLPAFVSVHTDLLDGFLPVEKVLADPELTGLAVNKALAEAEGWLSRWGGFFDHLAAQGQSVDPTAAGGRKIAQTIARVRKGMGSAWPTLSDDLS